MKVDFIDFKTVKLSSMLDTGMSAELSLTQTGKVSAKIPDEWNGYAVLYLSIKISDPEKVHPVLQKLYDRVQGIQYGLVEDTHKWCVEVK